MFAAFSQSCISSSVKYPDLGPPVEKKNMSMPSVSILSRSSLFDKSATMYETSLPLFSSSFFAAPNPMPLDEAVTKASFPSSFISMK